MSYMEDVYATTVVMSIDDACNTYSCQNVITDHGGGMTPTTPLRARPILCPRWSLISQ